MNYIYSLFTLSIVAAYPELQLYKLYGERYIWETLDQLAVEDIEKVDIISYLLNYDEEKREGYRYYVELCLKCKRNRKILKKLREIRNVLSWQIIK